MSFRFLWIPLAIVSAWCPFARAQNEKPPAAPPPQAAPGVDPEAYKTEPLRFAPDMPFVPLAHVEQRGTGPIPMVLIPGVASDWTVFDAFMTRNSERYTMYAVTLPGYGGDSAPPVPEGAEFGDGVWLTNAMDAVLKLIDDRQMDRPVVLGHSLGGHLAIRLAEKHSDKIRGAISLDGAPAFPMGSSKISPGARAVAVDGLINHEFSKIDDDAWAARMRSSGEGMVKDPARAKGIGEMCASVPRSTAVQYLLQLLAADVSEELSMIEVPVLLIGAVSDQGTADQKQSTRDFWRHAAEGSPKLSAVLFENTRHFVMDDAPQELDRAVREFVAGKPVEGKAK